MFVAGLMWGVLLCTRLIVMLLIAEVDCHDVDHLMFEDCQAIWLDCFRWHGDVENWKFGFGKITLCRVKNHSGSQSNVTS